MRKYEIMYLLSTRVEDPTQINSKLEALITGKEGKIQEIVNIGIRDLAYPIKKEKTANYFLVYVITNNENIEKFKTFTKISKDVLRILILNTELQKNYVQNNKLSATEINEDDFKKPTPYRYRRFNSLTTEGESPEGIEQTKDTTAEVTMEAPSQESDK